MANIKSAKKRIKTAEVRTLRNKMVKTSVKNSIKKYETALESGKLDDAKSALSEATHVIDKAAAKGVIHKNAAARKKSKLAVKLNKASAE
jgi:small subunit ribosomal protein S20